MINLVLLYIRDRTGNQPISKRVMPNIFATMHCIFVHVKTGQIAFGVSENAFKSNKISSVFLSYL